ncbi:MAG: tetratricopeptide repeat protein [Caldilineaceae bacterium]
MSAASGVRSRSCWPICVRAGQREEALLACRRALKDAEDPAEQARVYRRMGKLYEMHNQMHALTYYQQAAERFTASEPEFVQMLKDRAWLYIMRKEWDKAERDLNLALEQAPADAVEDRADIYDALASLHRHQQRYDVALTQAQRALSLREESGDLLRIAKGLGNLGLLYQAMQDHVHAIAAHQEAMTVYQRLGNQELTASALLNIGMAFHLDGRLQDAVQHYQQCLTLCQEIGYPLVEVKARSNLAEVFAELGQTVTARRHWQAGYALGLQAGFEDQTSYFVQLSRRFDGLAELTEPPADTEDTPTPLPASLSAESQAALLLAERQGQVTPRTLMDETGVSKATATRRLAELADSGFLARGPGPWHVLRPQRTPTAHTVLGGGRIIHKEQRRAATRGRTALLAPDLRRGRCPRGGIACPGDDPRQFRQEPTFRQFIDMQQHLSAALNRPVHLDATVA